MEITSENFNYMKYEETKLEYEDYIIACQTIGETADVIKRCLEDIRVKIQESTDISLSFDDEFLLRYLRAAKFDCSKSFDRLRRFYLTQKKNKDYFSAPMATSKAHLHDVKVSPYRMKGNIAVVINKMDSRSDPQGLTLQEKFYLDVLAGEGFLSNPVNQMCGIAVILDTTEISLSQMLYYPPRFIRMTLDCLLSYPVRPKTMHVVNTSTAGKILFNLFYAGFSKKFRERVHVHSKGESWDVLHSYIPPEVLPEEYGGILKNEDMIYMLNDLHSLQTKFHKNSPVALPSCDINEY